MALRLPLVREVVRVPAEAVEVEVRGELLPALPLALALGLSGPAGRLAVVTEASPPVALRVDAVHSILDLSQAEVFQLPARTPLPQPAPFQGAVVAGGIVWLELAPAAAGWVPLEPAPGEAIQLLEADLPAGREMVFERAGRRFAVPLSLLVRVVEGPRLFPVPLSPPAHRGLLYHERALFPCFDLGALLGENAPSPAGASAHAPAGSPVVVLLDAAGTAVGIAADRIAPAGAAAGAVRPAWDALFSS